MRLLALALLTMVLQSTSGQEETLRELFRRLKEGSLPADAHVQDIIAAGEMLLAPPSRERLPNLRHHCSAFSIPLRVEGSRGPRPVKDLGEDLAEALRRKALGLLGPASLSASSASEHAVAEELLGTEHAPPKSSRQQGPA